MAGGIEAATVLVPEGWVASGGIEWLPAWPMATTSTVAVDVGDVSPCVE
jgi:hypothetical protein